MQEIKSKDWSKMQAYFDWNKDKFKNALEKMNEYSDLDFKQMYFDDPILFMFFVNIHEKDDNTYDRELFWNLHCQAYYQLKKDDFFNTNINCMKLKVLQEFEAKVNGACLLSVKEINTAKTTTKKLNEKSVFFDFHEILEMIEKAYDIRTRGFFSNLVYLEQNKFFNHYFPDADYDEVGRILPITSLEANYMSLINDYFSQRVDYVDFWHYLLDGDFENVSNGSINTLYSSDESVICLKEAIKDKESLKDYICHQIRNLFFKELSQLKEVGTDPESIKFHIDW